MSKEPKAEQPPLDRAHVVAQIEAIQKYLRERGFVAKEKQ